MEQVTARRVVAVVVIVAVVVVVAALLLENANCIHWSVWGRDWRPLIKF